MSLAALAPFRIRSYRFQWPADLLTSCAFEMETLILGWYVLVETSSVIMLTIFGAMYYGGTLIAPMLGVASDRIGHLTLLSGMRVIYAAVAATLTALAFAGLITPLLACCIAAITGLVRPSTWAARRLIAETMPTDHIGMGLSAPPATLRRSWQVPARTAPPSGRHGGRDHGFTIVRAAHVAPSDESAPPHPVEDACRVAVARSPKVRACLEHAAAAGAGVDGPSTTSPRSRDRARRPAWRATPSHRPDSSAIWSRNSLRRWPAR